MEMSYKNSVLTGASNSMLSHLELQSLEVLTATFVGYQSKDLLSEIFAHSHSISKDLITTCSTIEQALLLCHELNKCNLFVLDANSESDQLQKFINKIKEENNEHIFILYSNKFSHDFIDKAFSLKVDDYLYSELSIENIIERILFLCTYKSKANTISEPIIETVIKFNKSSIAKCLLDIFIALVILMILSPILLLIILLIKIESPGPAFFVSKRVGKNYKIFDFYKFRTMKVGADNMRAELKHLNRYSKKESQSINPNDPFFFKIKNDPRVTKVGKILRKTSLDELPQLINVLKGDMSLVGNRPLPIDEAASLTKDRWAIRFLAPSGITGLWQISKRKESMSVRERVKLDLVYRKQMSMSKDIKILLKTIPSMLQQDH